MPNEVPLNELLGPLPEPDVTALSDYFDAAGQRQSLAYSVDAVRALLAAERERWLMALDPRRWTAAHSAAWHRNLPDTQAAFDALRSLANGGPNAGVHLDPTAR